MAESEEIAQRLRDEHRFRFGFHEDGDEAPSPPSLYTDAADLIEAQHAENERLRERIDRLEWAILHPSTADALVMRAGLLEASQSGSSESCRG